MVVRRDEDVKVTLIAGAGGHEAHRRGCHLLIYGDRLEESLSDVNLCLVKSYSDHRICAQFVKEQKTMARERHHARSTVQFQLLVSVFFQGRSLSLRRVRVEHVSGVLLELRLNRES